MKRPIFLLIVVTLLVLPFGTTEVVALYMLGGGSSRPEVVPSVTELSSQYLQDLITERNKKQLALEALPAQYKERLELAAASREALPYWESELANSEVAINAVKDIQHFDANAYRYREALEKRYQFAEYERASHNNNIRRWEDKAPIMVVEMRYEKSITELDSEIIRMKLLLATQRN